MLGENAGLAIAAVMAALYLYAVREAARCPDLPQDIDIDNPKALDTWPTVQGRACTSCCPSAR